jgi:phosphopantothenoylcysteine decarboxylase/phosphopantothenate--cysteine ligase
MLLKGKKIIIGVTGSIAAYKIPILIRLLKKEGAEVQVLMTPAAKDFVTPLTLSTLSQQPVFCESFNPVDGKWNSHIEMGNWADLLLIAPVSANTLGKMANGTADNLLLTTYLAAKCPVMFAPAMDMDMYRHPSTQASVAKLQGYGNFLIAPKEGELASGLCGAGRMEEPEEIVKIVAAFLKKKKSLNGKKVLITAGPTHEAIDPVRFIGNQSSGQMGFELAREAAGRGASVTLIAGPVQLTTPDGDVKRVDVVTASEMFNACMKHFSASGIVIMAAAVADYGPAAPAVQKIHKRDQAQLSMTLKANKDILAEMGRRRSKKQVLVGFALETDHEEKNAIQKLKNKNLDIIVLNSLKDTGAGFGHATNNVRIFRKDGSSVKTGLKPKRQIAAEVFNEIEHLITNK